MLSRGNPILGACPVPPYFNLRALQRSTGFAPKSSKFAQLEDHTRHMDEDLDDSLCAFGFPFFQPLGEPSNFFPHPFSFGPMQTFRSFGGLNLNVLPRMQHRLVDPFSHEQFSHLAMRYQCFNSTYGKRKALETTLPNFKSEYSTPNGVKCDTSQSLDRLLYFSQLAGATVPGQVDKNDQKT